MSESPEQKRPKLELEPNELKRPIADENSAQKRKKKDSLQVEEESDEKKLQALKRKNFITACERVSYQAYFDHRSRFKLLYIPSCLSGTTCKHNNYKHVKNNKPMFQTTVSPMPGYAEESFKIEVTANMWHDALEVCHFSLTSQQYLSANVLKDIAEIILNAHDDNESEYSISQILDECQQILSENFSTHPPCLIKSLRKCYIEFLTSPMDLRDNTFTNRTEFACDKGLVKYCMNRLEYELSPASKDGPLIEKLEHTPDEMKQSVKGLHWQKEKFEIFELLERKERIQRLMTVLDSVVELLQFDLAIWHSRHTSNQGRHIMRSHKPLMAYVLWSNNVLYTGAVNINCRQILRLFVQLVHLGYPETDIRIMITLLNTVSQTFYICETNSDSDYPNTGKYCMAFAKEFYKVISELPNKSVNRVLEAIQPSFMMHLIGILHIKTIMHTNEDNILIIMIDFIKNSKWKEFPESSCKINSGKISGLRKPKHVKKLLKYLHKKFETWKTQEPTVDNEIVYSRQEEIEMRDLSVDQSHVIQTLYITLQAYLDSFSVHMVQQKLETLNDLLDKEGKIDTEETPDGYAYSVTEHFIKKFKVIYQLLKELMILFHNMKSEQELPDILKVFEHVEMLGL